MKTLILAFVALAGPAFAQDAAPKREKECRATLDVAYNMKLDVPGFLTDFKGQATVPLQMSKDGRVRGGADMAVTVKGAAQGCVVDGSGPVGYEVTGTYERIPAAQPPAATSMRLTLVRRAARISATNSCVKNGDIAWPMPRTIDRQNEFVKSGEPTTLEVGRPRQPGWQGTIVLKLGERCPNVEAVPGGPYTPVRAETLTLDGSKSKGPIKTYLWDFTPGKGCPAELEPFRIEGARPAGFRVLCPLQATLTVRGEDDFDIDSQDFAVEVSPRKWKTEFDPVGKQGTFDEDMSGLDHWFGRNRCALDDPTGAHWIHRPQDQGIDWESKDSYESARVDSGPFAGYWYVKDAHLQIHRLHLINLPLEPGKEVSRLNPRSFMTLLRDEIFAHERWHTQLAKDWFDQNPARDPAIEIEALVYQTREQLRGNANDRITRFDEALTGASSEPAVRQKLVDEGRFDTGGNLLIPTQREGGTKVIPIPHLYDLGVD